MPRKQLDPVGFRTCRFCHKLKPLEEMVAHAHAQQGRDTKCRECQRVYLKGFTEKYKPIRNKLFRERKEKDPRFKLETNTRSVIRHALAYGQDSVLKRITGANLSELREAFVPHFQEGMTWDEKSKWTIDHYVPVSYLDILDPKQFRICNKWKNIRNN